MPAANMGEIYNSVLGKLEYWKVILRHSEQRLDYLCYIFKSFY